MNISNKDFNNTQQLANKVNRESGAPHMVKLPSPSQLGARSLTLLLVAFYATPLFAQHKVLEEVIVTATKRDQLLRDIPASIAHMSGDELEQRAIQNAQDMVN